MTDGIEESTEFGTFRLFPSQRLLLDGDKPLRLGGRAFDLLVALVESAGRLVSREELTARVWPSTVVDEASLRVHIGALRKVLGDGQQGVRYITNVPGRGYSFVGRVTPGSPAREVARDEAGTRAPGAASHNLPVRLTRMVGRGSAVRGVAGQLEQSRLVTIAGPGGMGKTTLAVAVAEERLGRYAHGVRFVDLAVLSDAQLVGAAVASAIGQSVEAGEVFEGLVSHLKDRQLLLVLDNCEHVIDAAATLSVTLLKALPQLSILATSREPLRAEGESVHRLAALALPEPGGTVPSAQQALQYPAVQLLMERVASSVDGYELTDAEADLAVQLCRRLDGIPLAIELAAVRVEFFGMRELVARLDDGLRVLSRGHRTVLPRHQTLRALLDWSYHLLTPIGQRVLSSLSVFAGGFTLEAAAQVAGDDALGVDAVLDEVSELVAKSLLVTDLNGDAVRYRLLHTTRSYAAEQLQHRAETGACRRRHLQYLLKELEPTSRRSARVTRPQSVAQHSTLIDEVHVALDWAFGESGDVALGAELTLASAWLAHQLSSLQWYRTVVERALTQLRRIHPPRPLLELQLTTALGGVVGQSLGQAIPEVASVELEGAAQCDEDLARMRAETLYGRWAGQFGNGAYPEALESALNLQAWAREHEDESTSLVATRALAQTYHHLGQHDLAAELAHRVLADPRPMVRLGEAPLIQVDRRVSMRIVLARILWLKGHASRASAMAMEALRFSEADVGYSRCQAIALAACPIALWSGDLNAAKAFADTLIEQSHVHRLPYWKSWAENFLAVASDGDQPVVDPNDAKQLDMFGTFGPRYLHPSSLARVESGAVGWCAPEVLRARGQQLALGGDEQRRLADDFFAKSCRLARQQGAIAWEVRATTSRCRLLQALGRPDSAREQLHSVLQRIDASEGSSDLADALALQGELA